jgi:hypothetical protein
MFSVAVPGFVRVIICAVEVAFTVVVGIDRLEGVSTAMGAGTAMPVPVSIAVWTEPAALSAIEMLAAKLATDCGENVTEIVQVAFTASVLLQLLVSAKSDGFAPVTLMPEILNGDVPELRTVIV